jgi:3-hydroxyacyl-[acyl-carrier-protein] dehydratase
MSAASQSETSLKLDIKGILAILPHRYPFLLVDRVLELNPEAGTITAQKNVSMNEEFFQGHFPDAPIMPGVLILEALAQTGAILLHHKGFHDKMAVFLNVNNAKFRIPVRPGDILILQAIGIHFSDKGGKIEAKALVNDKVAAQAEIGFALVNKDQI